MEESLQNLCQNTTSGNDIVHCYEVNNSGANETMLVEDHNVEMADTVPLELHVKYYVEGVILVPVAIVGMFGK